MSLSHIRMNLSHNRMNLSHNRMNLSHDRMNLSHNRMNLSHNRISLLHNRMSLSHNRINLSHNRMSLSNDRMNLSHKAVMAFHSVSSSMIKYQNFSHFSFETFSAWEALFQAYIITNNNSIYVVLSISLFFDHTQLKGVDNLWNKNYDFNHFEQVLLPFITTRFLFRIAAIWNAFSYAFISINYADISSFNIS